MKWRDGYSERKRSLFGGWAFINCCGGSVVMKYKNMKIAITDEANFKAVCEVLNTLGYQCEFIPTSYVPLCIATYEDGVFCAYSYEVHSAKTYTLDSLLKMRDGEEA